MHVRQLLVKQPSDWNIKARIGFRGDAVRDPDGLSAVFQEFHASVPSSIAVPMRCQKIIHAPLRIAFVLISNA